MRGVIQQVLLSLKAASAAAGVVIGNVSASSAVTSGTTITWSHTCISGANLLVASCLVRGTGALPTLSATYNGVAMTLKPSSNQSLGSLRRTATFTIDSTALTFDTTAHNIVITSTQTITDAEAGAIDFGGVDVNGGPFGSLATNSGASTTTSVTVVGNTDDVAYAMWGADNGTNGAPLDSQTEVYDTAGVFNGSSAGYKTAPAASQTMRSTITNSNWVSHGFTIRPSGIGTFDKALLHMNGTDGSTTFTDESGKTWTAQGNAQIDTAQSVFGGASMLLDGTGDYLSTPDHADFELGSGDFTVDFRVRFNSISAPHALVGKWSTAGSPRSWLIYLNDANTLQFYWSTNGSVGGTGSPKSFSWTPSTATWYHVACTRAAGSLRMFINGSQIGATESVSATFFDGAADVTVGGTHNGAALLNGWIDELRISKGIARWSDNFTPPTAEHSLW